MNVTEFLYYNPSNGSGLPSQRLVSHFLVYYNVKWKIKLFITLTVTMSV